MPIFRLAYQREVVEETIFYVEADDEWLLRQHLDDVEECLDDEDWQVFDVESPELYDVYQMSQDKLDLYYPGGPYIHKEHHFHYEDAEPKPEPPDPRQLKLFAGLDHHHKE